MRFLLPFLGIAVFLIAVEDELTSTLVALESRLYTGWQQKSTGPIESLLAPEAIAWGEYGTLDRAQQIDAQKNANRACTVKSFRFRDATVLRVSPDAALLVYKADQDADCGGKVPTPISNSTLYVRRNGVWKILYRASVVPKP